MDSIAFAKNDQIIKVEINEYKDCIYFAKDDSNFLSEFVNMHHSVMICAKEAVKEIDEAEKKYAAETEHGGSIEKQLEYVNQCAKVNLEVSKKAVEAIERVLGEGTIKKYFRKIYEHVPTYVPGPESLVEFVKQITPVVEKIYDTKISENNDDNTDNGLSVEVYKYQPQDHRPENKNKKKRKKGR